MPPPEPPKPRPKLPSRPELPINVDKVVGAAGRHAGSQEYVRPELARKGTLPGGMSAVPQPPPLPTVPAENPLRKKTWRVPTPPSAVAQARRSDPPTTIDQPRAQTPVSGQPGVDQAAEADARNVAGSFPPPISEKPSDPRGISTDRRHRTAEAAKTDLATDPPPDRGAWQKLAFKIATAIVAALVLVIGALAYWGVAAINAKTEALKEAQEAKKKADSREEQWRSWASVVIWIEDCRDSRDVRSGEMLLPDPQKMGAARKLEPWQNPCSPKLPPPP